MKLISFGEMLFDLLPDGRVPGGAPMNVAVHAAQLGATVDMISRVGDDELGAELRAFLEERGVGTALVQVDAAHDTSTVVATIGADHEVSYEIVEGVAWDFIEATDSAKAAVASADVLSFGSLAVRSAPTYAALKALLPHARKRAFDVNLRPPFYTKAGLEELMHASEIVKMNQEELHIVGAWVGDAPDERALAEAVRAHYGIEWLCVTLGKHGAMLLHESGQWLQSTISVTVKDTVGSGDSFFAAFLTQLLTGTPPQEALRGACATGAYVATQRGAVPVLDWDTINDHWVAKS